MAVARHVTDLGMAETHPGCCSVAPCGRSLHIGRDPSGGGAALSLWQCYSFDLSSMTLNEFQYVFEG
jgi:hypothetical protein